jgi:hypothetical protein
MRQNEQMVQSGGTTFCHIISATGGDVPCFWCLGNTRPRSETDTRMGHLLGQRLDSLGNRFLALPLVAKARQGMTKSMLKTYSANVETK